MRIWKSETLMIAGAEIIGGLLVVLSDYALPLLGVLNESDLAVLGVDPKIIGAIALVYGVLRCILRFRTTKPVRDL